VYKATTIVVLLAIEISIKLKITKLSHFELQIDRKPARQEVCSKNYCD